MLRSAYEKLQIENKALKKKATASQASMEPLLVETRTLQASITTLQSGIDDLKTELEATKSQAQQQAQSIEPLWELCTQRFADYTLKESNALSRKEKVISLKKENARLSSHLKMVQRKARSWRCRSKRRLRSSR